MKFFLVNFLHDEHPVIIVLYGQREYTSPHNHKDVFSQFLDRTRHTNTSWYSVLLEYQWVLAFLQPISCTLHAKWIKWPQKVTRQIKFAWNQMFTYFYKFPMVVFRVVFKYLVYTAKILICWCTRSVLVNTKAVKNCLEN